MNIQLEKRLKEVIENKCKLCNAEMKVVMGYKRTIKHTDSAVLIFDTLIWEHEYEEFTENLKRYKVKEFILNDSSTELMGLLQFIIRKGYTVDGIQSYYDVSLDTPVEMIGLLIRTNY